MVNTISTKIIKLTPNQSFPDLQKLKKIDSGLSIRFYFIEAVTESRSEK